MYGAYYLVKSRVYRVCTQNVQKRPTAYGENTLACGFDPVGFHEVFKYSQLLVSGTVHVCGEYKYHERGWDVHFWDCKWTSRIFFSSLLCVA